VTDKELSALLRHAYKFSVRVAANSCKSGVPILHRERPHRKSRSFFTDDFKNLKRVHKNFKIHRGLEQGCEAGTGAASSQFIFMEPRCDAAPTPTALAPNLMFNIKKNIFYNVRNCQKLKQSLLFQPYRIIVAKCFNHRVDFYSFNTLPSIW
jgi:hypothetical protein